MCILGIQSISIYPYIYPIYIRCILYSTYIVSISSSTSLPSSSQDIDFDGFRRFLDAFLDCETPLDLAKHLFVSFLKPNVTQAQLHGKALNQMAAISSTAACAPVTSHTKGKSASSPSSALCPTCHPYPYPYPFPLSCS